ncbi:MAG: pyruvate kinase [Bacteroidales bacterium]|nr:pyruvate kinase [Bacteroidales bacterium]
MSKFTKIVATISDWRSDVEFLQELYDSGMNVVRMNSAHLTNEGFLKIIQNVRAVSPNIGLLVDTKGPEVRTTPIANNEKIRFEAGDIVQIIGDPKVLTTKECIAVSYPNLMDDMNVGYKMLIDDGELEFTVTEKKDHTLICIAENSGELGSRKSVNVPGVRINLPSLTKRDEEVIQLAIENKIDFIAHSFVRTRQDVLDIQKILDAKKSNIKIISKIENQEGVDNIDEILEVTYGVMIARGDLGIEVAQEKIPGIQRQLIRKCVQAKKPVIVATQMLHSMISNPRPTRAEVTDIANAIYYRTDALMLSGETAYGKYPVESVRTMAKIAEEAEKTKMPENDIPVNAIDSRIASFLAEKAVHATQRLNVQAIITDAYTGGTARYVAAFRGVCPVFAICYHEDVIRHLALSYGVFPIYQAERGTAREYFFDGIYLLLRRKHIKESDVVAFLGGSFGEGGGTTYLEINEVSKILNHSSDYILPNFCKLD